MKEMVKISSKGQVTLPKRLRDKYQLKPGEYVNFDDTDGRIEIKKASTSPVEKFDDLAGNIRKRFKEKGIKSDEVEDAIQWAREEKQS